MSEAAYLLAEARRISATLYGEIVELRGKIEGVPADIIKARDAFRELIAKVETYAMSIHDDVLSVLSDIDADVDQLIAKKGSSDAAFADVQAKAQSLKDKIAAALNDAPASTSGSDTSATTIDTSLGSTGAVAG